MDNKITTLLHKGTHIGIYKENSARDRENVWERRDEQSTYIFIYTQMEADGFAKHNVNKQLSCIRTKGRK